MWSYFGMKLEHEDSLTAVTGLALETLDKIPLFFRLQYPSFFVSVSFRIIYKKAIVFLLLICTYNIFYILIYSQEIINSGTLLLLQQLLSTRDPEI